MHKKNFDSHKLIADLIISVYLHYKLLFMLEYTHI